MDTLLWTSPSNGQTYPIQVEGRTSPTLLRLLSRGRVDLLNGKAFVYNATTGRVVQRSKVYTNKGVLRAAAVAKGFVAKATNPNVVYIAETKDLEELHHQRGNDFVDDTYFALAKPYNARGKSDQERINKDPKLVEKRVAELKAAGRIELDGNPREIADALMNFGNGNKKNGAQAMKAPLAIAYVTKDGLYRCGGFVRHVSPKDLYVAIATDKGLSFSLNLKNAKAVYVKAVDTKKKVVE